MSPSQNVRAPSALDDLLQTVARATGLEPRKDWRARATEALDEVATQRGLAAEHLYADRTTWPELIPSVVAAVTVQETFFFRHRPHFDALSELVAARLARGDRARIWSAGCATGEEPYSMAMAVAMRCGPKALDRVDILASDLSPAAIRRAERATYGAWSFREVPAAELSDWLDRSGKEWRPITAMRTPVRFELADTLRLARTLPDRSLDAVFFRNVGIYLAPEALSAIHAELARVLADDGLFFVAPVDPRPTPSLFTVTSHASTSVYRRTMPEPLPAVAPRAESPGPEKETRRGRRRPKLDAAPAPSREAPTLPAPEVELPAGTAELADRGALEDAARRLSGATAVADVVLRGQIHVAASHREEAIGDFRMALYRDPAHRLARFWYAVALRDGGLAPEALRQLRVLRRVLLMDEPTATVEDGTTRVAELLEAAQALETELA